MKTKPPHSWGSVNLRDGKPIGNGRHQVNFDGIPSTIKGFERKPLTTDLVQTIDDDFLPLVLPDIQTAIPGWRTFILTLENPIFLRDDVEDIIQSPDFRIYPPFLIDQERFFPAYLNGERIPAGVSHVTHTESIPTLGPDSIRLKMNLKGQSPRVGLRIDIRGNMSTPVALARKFLRVCRLYSSQWWLTSRINPFDLGLRRLAEIDANFSPVSRTSPDWIQGSWIVSHSYNQVFGFEKSIDSASWRAIGRLCAEGFLFDPAIDIFMDALVEYVEERDDKAILFLFTSLEIAASRRLAMRGSSGLTLNGLKLLKRAEMINSESDKKLRMLLEDRNKVAHGKQPAHVGAKYRIEDAVELTHKILQAYLERCGEFGWIRSLKLG